MFVAEIIPIRRVQTLDSQCRFNLALLPLSFFALFRSSLQKSTPTPHRQTTNRIYRVFIIVCAYNLYSLFVYIAYYLQFNEEHKRKGSSRDILQSPSFCIPFLPRPHCQILVKHSVLLGIFSHSRVSEQPLNICSHHVFLLFPRYVICSLHYGSNFLPIEYLFWIWILLLIVDEIRQYTNDDSMYYLIKKFAFHNYFFLQITTSGSIRTNWI